MSDDETRYGNKPMLEGNASEDYTQPDYARFQSHWKPGAWPNMPTNRDDPEHTIHTTVETLLTGDYLNPISDNL